MTAVPKLGIDHLTVNGMPPVAFARLAAQAGCDSISLFARRLAINPFGFPEWSLVSDHALRRDTARAAADLGLEIALGEGCAIHPGRDVADCLPMVEAFAELGARRINLLSFEPDRARDFDQMCRFSELAGRYGIAVCAEFSARPGRPKLPEFIERIDRTGSAHCTMLIDAMHFFAAGQQVADLAAIAPARLGYLQLCDARLDEIDDYMAAALHERLIPGDGALPLPDLIAALPADIAVSMEIPQVGRSASGESHLARLRDAAHRCRALLAARAPFL